MDKSLEIASQHIEEMVSKLLKQMTLEEKVSLVSGRDFWSLHAIPRLGIPSLSVADGPTGLRSPNSDPATVFPVGVAVAASWNPELVEQMSGAIACEAIAYDVDVLLAPTVNIQRTPLGGRNFECYSEDPMLAGEIAIAYVRGAQKYGIGTSLKHYAANNQEHERMRGSSELSQRALREIYLPAFERVVKEANPWTIMGAYNRVNGVFACENTHLIRDVLKEEWKYDGVVLSDWGAVKSTVNSACAGLDLEMPGPAKHYGVRLVNAVNNWQVPQHTVDDMARRVLRLVVRSGRLDGNPKAKNAALNTQAHNDIAKKLAAESIVLLKNTENLLPMSHHMKRVAIIGAPANSPTIQGGGSSQVAPFKITTPLEALQAALSEDLELTYAQGVDHEPELPIADYRLFSVDAEQASVFGLNAKYYTEANWRGNVVWEQQDKIFAKLGFGKIAQQDSSAFSVEWSGCLHAPRTGTYEFSIQHSNPDIEFLLDNKVFVDDSTERNPVDLFGMLTMYNRTFSVYLEAGQSYPVRLRYSQPAEGAIPGFNILKFNMRVPAEDRQVAIENARKANMAIVFVGSGTTEESEGMDRTSMRLSSSQSELVESVCAVNKSTVVVVNSGACIEMPWADKVSAIVQMWLPGQAGGAAIADVLLGRVNPSGKLPVTFPVRYEDNPTYPHYPGGKRVQYGEDIFVGYRYYDKVGIAPLFPFGHGLSYTNFSYNNLSVSEQISPDSPVKVSIDLQNVGTCEGAEVVQLYIGNHASSEAQAKAQLRKFKKVRLTPNQSKRVDFMLGFRDFAYYDTSLSRWMVAPGEYEIKLGSSSRDFRASAKIDIPEGYYWQ